MEKNDRRSATDDGAKTRRRLETRENQKTRGRFEVEMEKESLELFQVKSPASLELRKKFVETFVNCRSQRYEKTIKPFKNVENTTQAYWGYLWDNIDKNNCLIDYCNQTNIEKAMKGRNLFDSPVYLTWDVHIPRYDATLINLNNIFRTQGVIKISFSSYLQHAYFFPEDVYFFDESYEWCAILTHEETENGRWCLWIKTAQDTGTEGGHERTR